MANPVQWSQFKDQTRATEPRPMLFCLLAVLAPPPAHCKRQLSRPLRAPLSAVRWRGFDVTHMPWLPVPPACPSAPRPPGPAAHGNAGTSPSTRRGCHNESMLLPSPRARSCCAPARPPLPSSSWPPGSASCGARLWGSRTRPARQVGRARAGTLVPAARARVLGRRTQHYLHFGCSCTCCCFGRCYSRHDIPASMGQRFCVLKTRCTTYGPLCEPDRSAPGSGLDLALLHEGSSCGELSLVAGRPLW